MKTFCKDKLNKKPFIIAEVGQNHNGSLETALKFVKIFSFYGASAIKFQSRNNKFLFSKEAYDTTYNSANSFGKTYGEHREHLELSSRELSIIKNECKKHNVKFMSTPFDEPSLKMLIKINVDILKIASFDLGNLPFIDAIGKTKKPIVLSTGGGKNPEIKASINHLSKLNKDLAILHCVSEYPTEYNRLGLENIIKLKKKYPELIIGSSDHFNGILSGPVAYLQGARVFEKHVTLNRGWKGTDQSFALEPEGFSKFVRDINRVNKMLPSKSGDTIGNEPVFKRLGKSIIAASNIKKGDKFTIDNLSGKIFSNQYIPVRESYKLIGEISNKNYNVGDIIQFKKTK